VGIECNFGKELMIMTLIAIARRTDFWIHSGGNHRVVMMAWPGPSGSFLVSEGSFADVNELVMGCSALGYANLSPA
jgi:hypothetical protein